MLRIEAITQKIGNFFKRHNIFRMQRQEIMQKIKRHLNSIITQSSFRSTAPARKQPDMPSTVYNSSDGLIYCQTLSLMIKHLGQIHIFLHQTIMTIVSFCILGVNGYLLNKTQGLQHSYTSWFVKYHVRTSFKLLIKGAAIGLLTHIERMTVLAYYRHSFTNHTQKLWARL